jgi:hypothetical protein
MIETIKYRRNKMEIFRNNEKEKIERIINSGWFNGDPGNGEFDGRKYPFVLKYSDNNFYKPILNSAKDYFNKNDIAWWKGKEPTGHALSSQIACVNHLFPLRNDKEAVLSLLSSFSSDFIDVLKITTDQYASEYISFEQVSDNDLLNEGKPARGTNCTSIDACIYTLHKNGSRWLIPIEWKYTETYEEKNKGIGSSGETRHKRYDALIQQSSQLIYHTEQLAMGGPQGEGAYPIAGTGTSHYYVEPFYQLMRQTLWADQMKKHKNEETICADDYIHIHVVPSKNIDMLEKIYTSYRWDGQFTKKYEMNMEKTWRSWLINQDKYKLISPEIFLANVGNKYDDLKQYLSKRYWND